MENPDEKIITAYSLPGALVLRPAEAEEKGEKERP